MESQVKREDIDRLDKKIDELNRKLSDEQKISTAQDGRLKIIEKFLFGNGVEGLVKIIEKLRRSINEFQQDFELWKKAERVEDATEEESESKKRAMTGLRLRTIGIWFTGISLATIVIFNILEIVGVG